ncbi:TPA: hypothetical protein ACUNCG_003430 [Aeromonas hydrophila]
MSNKEDNAELISLKITHRELRYLIASGLALVQNIPESSLPTYCGFNKDEIIAMSIKLRSFADELGIDM